MSTTPVAPSPEAPVEENAEAGDGESGLGLRLGAMEERLLEPRLGAMEERLDEVGLDLGTLIGFTTTLPAEVTCVVGAGIEVAW